MNTMSPVIAPAYLAWLLLLPATFLLARELVTGHRALKRFQYRNTPFRDPKLQAAIEQLKPAPWWPDALGATLCAAAGITLALAAVLQDRWLS